MTKVHPGHDRGSYHGEGSVSLIQRAMRIEKKAERGFGFVVRLMMLPNEEDNSYTYYLKMHGPACARSQLTTSLSTIGVVDALIMSIVSSSLSSPPQLLLKDQTVLLVWFWVSVASVVSSFLSLILSVVILIVGAPVPDDAFEDFLGRIKLGFLFSVFMFVVSCCTNIATLAIGAFLIVPVIHFAVASFCIGASLLAAFFYGLWLWRVQRLENHRCYDEHCKSISLGSGGEDVGAKDHDESPPSPPATVTTQPKHQAKTKKQLPPMKGSLSPDKQTNIRSLANIQAEDKQLV